MSAVWQEELGDGAHEEGLARRLFHPFHESGLTFVAVDGAGQPELLHYWLLSRPDWPGVSPVTAPQLNFSISRHVCQVKGHGHEACRTLCHS
jgi:hypothetical protein